jgi:hypothetical protein
MASFSGLVAGIRVDGNTYHAYSVQDMALWAQDGKLILLARQTVAIFG